MFIDSIFSGGGILNCSQGKNQSVYVTNYFDLNIYLETLLINIAHEMIRSIIDEEFSLFISLDGPPFLSSPTMNINIEEWAYQPCHEIPNNVLKLNI